MSLPEPPASPNDPGAAHDALDPQMVVVLRAKSPAEKIAMIAAAGERVRQPAWTAEQIRAAAIRRVSGGTG
ncbi:MAG: hypothetical protein KF847_00130 [Pirellulales bacterium]|nr:hypothetical protein [Pirellulales bacterium]